LVYTRKGMTDLFKKINLIVIAFFSVLTVLFPIGFTLYLPLLIFYVLKDNRNIFYMLIPSFLALLLFAKEFVIYFLVLTAIVYILQMLLHRISKGFYVYGAILLLNVISSVILDRAGLINAGMLPSPWHLIILNIISLSFYVYLEHSLVEALKAKKMMRSLYDNSFLEILIALVTILGATWVEYQGVNAGLVTAVYFGMYFGTSFRGQNAMLYGVIAMLTLLFGFEIREGLFLPFVCAFYFMPFVYPIISLNIFLAVAILAKTDYHFLSLLSMMATSVVFEILKNFLIKEKVVEEEVYEKVYEQVTGQINQEILAFASFLERFSDGIKLPKEYNQHISDGIKTLVQKHCQRCDKQKECYSHYKAGLYIYFRDIIVGQAQDSDEYYQFTRYCPHVRELEYTGRSLRKNVALYDESETKNNSLVAQMGGIASAIRKYAVDRASKEELKYEVFAEVKRRIIGYGYHITYFEVKRTFVNDFLISLGIKAAKSEWDDIHSAISLICQNVMEKRVSVLFEKEERNTLYLKIIPEIKIDVLYGYGAIASDGTQINGDNYIIKDLNNGRFISAISDGMGKGYSAFYESNITLKLVEDVLSLNLDSSTALEILNTFYVIQDYLERYATLDLLEINRFKTTAKFYKMGGCTSYIIHQDGSLEKIINKSLPFGIEELVENYEVPLKDNDVIIMSSDGILENVVDTNRLETFLKSVKDLTPQRIVYELFNFAVKNELKTNDDMTLIALRIKEA
jgi:hypothetical protein